MPYSMQLTEQIPNEDDDITGDFKRPLHDRDDDITEISSDPLVIEMTIY